MDILLTIALCYGGFLLAYHTYGRWLSRKIFSVSEEHVTPANELCDNVDYCPTPRMVVFGHHFTSIAGTGPIVGPAIAVFWGWLPALLWIVFGSIFIGAVHDFSALVVSLRNRGVTIGEIAGRYISPRARILFLLVLLFALSVVLGIFGLVIAIIFSLYPETVLPVWLQLPLAMFIGFWIYKRKASFWGPSLVILLLLYGLIAAGSHLPISLGLPLFAKAGGSPFATAVVVWTLILFVYCYVASTLPVWMLLQPRDFINSFQLFVALALLVLGALVAGFSGTATMTGTAPAIADALPADALALFPFLFITVACGAVSGFHSLVSSGTSSKQLRRET
ncbi:MAG: carbon starvation protein A, partial [Lentisphaerae bacterium]